MRATNYNKPKLQDARTYAFGNRITMVEADKMVAEQLQQPRPPRCGNIQTFENRITMVEADKKFATHRNIPELQDAGT